MRLCSEVEGREEEVLGWQEGVQQSIGQERGGEADGNLCSRHET
jgi:hypothetical protein